LSFANFLALLAFVIREALGSRLAPGTPSAKRSVGTRRAASMQDTLSEGTHTRSAAGTFSGERSPPARSEDLPPEMWLPTLSDDERLLYAARSRVLSSTSRLYYYIKCTCHMPQEENLEEDYRLFPP
jgi:hypothetical protein